MDDSADRQNAGAFDASVCILCIGKAVEEPERRFLSSWMHSTHLSCITNLHRFVSENSVIDPLGIHCPPQGVLFWNVRR